MNRKQRTLLIAAIIGITVIGVSIAMLNLYVDPYLSVDAVRENPDAYMGRNIQVKGKLQAGSLSITSESVTLIMYGEEHTITVRVTGELPSLQDDQDLVAIGELESVDIIVASEILAQCPSKYETNSTG